MNTRFTYSSAVARLVNMLRESSNGSVAGTKSTERNWTWPSSAKCENDAGVSYALNVLL